MAFRVIYFDKSHTVKFYLLSIKLLVHKGSVYIMFNTLVLTWIAAIYVFNLIKSY